MQVPTAVAVADISGALRRVRNCVFIAITAVKLRYRRAALGPLWVPITSGTFIFSVSYLYSGFIPIDYASYVLNIALGWTNWQFIYKSIIQGAQTFQRGSEVIQTSNIEKFSFVLITVVMNLFVFVLNLPVVVLAFAVAGAPWSSATWLVIPGSCSSF